MKYHEKWFAVLVALAIFTSGCTGDSEAAPEPTSVPTADIGSSDPDPTPTGVVGPAPTEVAEREVGDEDFIAAAVAALDADVERGDGPADLFAYDLLDSSVNEDGLVTLTICGWTGDTVFDGVYDSQWRTEVNTAGAVSASHLTTPVAPGECLNTQLINSALETANQFDAYWTEISAEPDRFATDERSNLLTPRFFEISEELVDGWLSDGVQILGTRIEGDLQEAGVADTLWRRSEVNDIEALQLAFCRDMDPARGRYRDGVLIDSGRAAESAGLHSIDAFQLAASPTERGVLRVGGRSSLIWADCFVTGDWLEGVNGWLPQDVSFRTLDQ